MAAPEPHRPWPLRASLAALLALLVTFALTIDSTGPALAGWLAPTPTSTRPPSPMMTADPAETERTEPNRAQLPAGVIQTAPLPDFQPARSGCNLTMDAPLEKQKLGSCTVIVVGDSLGNNLGAGLSWSLRNQKGLNLKRLTKASTGLSNSWFYDWPRNLKLYLKRYRPNLVVMMLGANDRQNMKTADGVLTFGTPAWKRAYSEQISRIAQMTHKSGAYLLWVGLPVMRPVSYGEGMQVLDSLYAKAAGIEPGMTYVPTFDYFADANGQYQTSVRVNGKYKRVRGDDGIHFSTSGQLVLGSLAVRQLSDIYRVNLRDSDPLVVTK